MINRERPMSRCKDTKTTTKTKKAPPKRLPANQSPNSDISYAFSLLPIAMCFSLTAAFAVPWAATLIKASTGNGSLSDLTSKIPTLSKLGMSSLGVSIGVESLFHLGNGKGFEMENVMFRSIMTGLALGLSSELVSYERLHDFFNHAL